jgi:hypothetical protein
MFVCLSNLFVRQLVNLIRHPDGNGKAATRAALFLLTMFFFLDTSFSLLGDLGFFFAGVDKQLFLQQSQFVLLLLKLFGLYAIWRFYRLIND